jgi:hypothetical protein
VERTARVRKQCAGDQVGNNATVFTADVDLQQDCTIVMNSFWRRLNLCLYRLDERLKKEFERLGVANIWEAERNNDKNIWVRISKNVLIQKIKMQKL